MTDAFPANFKCILLVRRFTHWYDHGRRDCLVNDKSETGRPQTVTSPRVATRRSGWKQDRPSAHLSAVKITKPNAVPQTPSYVSQFPSFTSRELAHSCAISRSSTSQVPSWVPYTDSLWLSKLVKTDRRVYFKKYNLLIVPASRTGRFVCYSLDGHGKLESLTNINLRAVRICHTRVKRSVATEGKARQDRCVCGRNQENNDDSCFDHVLPVLLKARKPLIKEEL